MRFADIGKFLLARYRKDASGHPAGIVGPDGIIRTLVNRRFNSLLLCGDSLSAFSEVTINATSITNNGDGTATVVFPTPHNAHVGAPLRVNVAPTQAMNVMDSKVLAVPSPTTMKIQLGGRTHGVVAANGSVLPNIIFPLRRTSRGWLNELEAEIGYQLAVTWCAVGGATAEQIAALLDATPMAEVADVSIVKVGMNNVYYGSTLASSWAATKSLIDKARAKSMYQIIMAIPPRDSTDAGNWTQAKQDIHNALNIYMQVYAQQIGSAFFDTGAASQNGLTYLKTSAANPDPNPEFMYDKTHGSARAARAVGPGLAQGPLAPLLGMTRYKPTHKQQLAVNAGNRLVNADFATSTNGVPNTWQIAGQTAGTNLVTAVEARSLANGDTDEVGNNFVAKFNFGTAAGSSGQFYFERYGVQGLFTTPGEVVQWLMEVAVSGSIELLALEIVITGTLSDGTTWMVSGGEQFANVKGVPGSYIKTLMTPKAAVPAAPVTLGATNMYVRALIGPTQTTDVTLKFYHPRIPMPLPLA